MATLRKIFITPFFGKLPPWWEQYKRNFYEVLRPRGYDWHFTQDLDDFNRRCRERFGFISPIQWGGGKLWDYRCCLGYLYHDVVRGYDYWGHTDFDCVYGRVDRWVSDDFLRELDLHSNHDTYVNGCWSLYRNEADVNLLFRQSAVWDTILKRPESTGWVESEFSRTLEASCLRYKYTFWQGWPYTVHPNLAQHEDRLYQDGQEIMMFHFRRSKKWPL